MVNYDKLIYRERLKYIVMSHRLPTDAEIRQRIEAIGTEWEVSDIKEIPNDHDSTAYRNAFKYQLLICGRISEVCGKYAPIGTDAFETEFEVPLQKEVVLEGRKITIIENAVVPAVMFIVKTAKRKGKLRSCSMPLDKKYEPWSRGLLDYFQERGSKHPFMFSQNRKHSIRYAQWVAEKTFDGLEWPMKEYSKAIEVEINPSQIVREGINQNNQEVYLIELDDGMRRWFTKIRENVVRDHVPIGERWKDFRSHGLRKRKNITNKYFYLFDGFDRAAYGGWTEKSRVESMPDAESHYSHLDIQQMAANEVMLKQMAMIYFPKLLRPYPKGGIQI